MSIESKVFRCKRFVNNRLLEYGFEESETGYYYSAEFMDGDFRAELTVTSSGELRASVIDLMNEEEYVQLRFPAFDGAYVNMVRSAYESLLEDIALNCCDDAYFALDQSNRIAERIFAAYGVSPDFPWRDDADADDPNGVFRHADSGKWFGVVLHIKYGQLEKSGFGEVGSERNNNKSNEMIDVLNLKIREEDADELHENPAVFPAFHMNHSKWISVLLDDTITDDEVMELVYTSYLLTSGSPAVMTDELIRKVLAIADSVPAGKVVSYGQIARMIGREKNSRLVGKIMSLADRYGDHPCHRVVNSAGRTVPGWSEQRELLEAEGVTFRSGGCVDMKKHQWEG